VPMVGNPGALWTAAHPSGQVLFRIDTVLFTESDGSPAGR
jgi:hypothetical protein